MDVAMRRPCRRRKYARRWTDAYRRCSRRARLEPTTPLGMGHVDRPASPRTTPGTGVPLLHALDRRTPTASRVPADATRPPPTDADHALRGFLFTGATARAGPGSGRGVWRDALLAAAHP